MKTEEDKAHDHWEKRANKAQNDYLLDKDNKKKIKAYAQVILTNPRIKKPSVEQTTPEALCDVFFELFTYEHQAKIILEFDDDADVYKVLNDRSRYYVERSESSRDYWDALCLIVARKLDKTWPADRDLDPYLLGWLIDMLRSERLPPMKRGGRTSQAYAFRNGVFCDAFRLLTRNDAMGVGEAITFIADEVSLSWETVRDVVGRDQNGQISV